MKFDRIDYSGKEPEELQKLIKNGVLPMYAPMSLEEYRSWMEEGLELEALSKEVATFIDFNPSVKSTHSQDVRIVLGNINNNTFPNLFKVLGKTREYEFQLAGGGTGDIDTDEADQHMDDMIVINRDYEHPTELIAGAYRFMYHQNSDSYDSGSMAKSFDISESMRKEKWIELGRSLKNSICEKKKIVVHLDLKAGLGFMASQCPGVDGFFGKVTLYKAHQLLKSHKDILGLMKKSFTEESLFTVKKNLRIEDDYSFNGNARKLLVHVKRSTGLVIPPVLLMYASMTDKIAYGGSFIHNEFGGSIESGIAIRFGHYHEPLLINFLYPYMNGRRLWI